MLTLLLALSGAAHADDGVYMWGVGPSVGTIVYPGRFPAWFPKDTEDDDGVDRLEKVGGDVTLGGRGTLYLDKSNRLGGRVGLGLGGGGYQSLSFTAEYEVLPYTQDSFSAFLGLGGGFGTMRFRPESDDLLHFATYILRGQAGALIRDKVRAYELDLFAQFNFPGIQDFTAAGADEGERVKGGFYAYLGLEGTVYFGDFTPPRTRTGKGSKGGRSASSSRSRSSSPSGSKSGTGSASDKKGTTRGGSR